MFNLVQNFLLCLSSDSTCISCHNAFIAAFSCNLGWCFITCVELWDIYHSLLIAKQHEFQQIIIDY